MATKYLNTTEVADLLRAPIETVRYWRHIGKGPTWFKISRRVVYELADVEAFIAQAKASSATPAPGLAATGGEVVA